jgi:tripeptidyl-peptidase-1
MLYRQLTAVIIGGLAVAAATPLSSRDVRRHEPAVKREVPASHILHERQLPHWSRKWKRGARVPREATLPMRIGLKQRNLEQGALLLREQ